MLIRFIFSAFLLGHLPLTLNAQDYPEIYIPSPGFNALPSELFEIQNTREENLVFRVSFDTENWRRIPILPYARIQFMLMKRAEAYFEIETGSSPKAQPIRYKVLGSKSYKLFWNDKSKKWDLEMSE